MSGYRDRRGQVIGSLTVVADHARTKRQKNGGRRVIWKCLDTNTGRHVYMRTSDLIKRDRQRIAREALRAAAE